MSVLEGTCGIVLSYGLLVNGCGSTVMYGRGLMSVKNGIPARLEFMCAFGLNNLCFCTNYVCICIECCLLESGVGW